MAFYKGKRKGLWIVLSFVVLILLALGIYFFQRFSADVLVKTATLKVTDTSNANNVAVAFANSTVDVAQELKVTSVGNVGLDWRVANLTSRDYCKSTNFKSIADGVTSGNETIAGISAPKTFTLRCFRQFLPGKKTPYDKEILEVSVNVIPYLRVYFKANDSTINKYVESIYDVSKKQLGEVVSLQVVSGAMVNFRYEVTPTSEVADCNRGAASGKFDQNITSNESFKITCRSMAGLTSTSQIDIKITSPITTPSPTVTPTPTPIDI